MPGKSVWLTLVLVLAAGAVLFLVNRRAPDPQSLVEKEPLSQANASPEAITAFCGDCHAMPDASIFPRFAWKMEVERGYQFFEKSGLPLQAPPLLEVVKFFEARAPESLPIRDTRPPSVAGWTSIVSPSWPGSAKPGEKKAPFAISHLKWGSLKDGEDPVLIACDMRGGRIASWNPKKPNEPWTVLVEAHHPARVEIADLDGDGLKDLLVADLGSFLPTDAKKGRALWYRGTPSGFEAPVTLLDQVGRVTDIQVIQSGETGSVELVVAVFGWNETGEIYHVRAARGNGDWSTPGKFEKAILDSRHGAIHVPVWDFNGDGKKDFVALFGQEHETVTLFLNQGKGGFEKRDLYKGAHPGLGSSGLQLTDLDGDGDMDLLVSQGDVLDQPYLLKPYHGIFWLENRGALSFQPHSIGPMYGVHRALAFRDPGRPEKGTWANLVSVAFLPKEGFPQREAMKLESILLWKPNGENQWSPAVLESITADHVACEVGDFWGPASIGIAAGDFSGAGAPVTLYRPPSSPVARAPGVP